jgi:hypothetical protein
MMPVKVAHLKPAPASFELTFEQTEIVSIIGRFQLLGDP